MTRLMSCGLLLVALFSAVVSANAQSEGGLLIFEACKPSVGTKMVAFEQKHRFTFSEAAATAHLNARYESLPSPERRATFCNSLIGEKYGQVKFTTTPKSASIEINGKGQQFSSNSAGHPFVVGTYAFKMTLGKKICNGDVVVSEDAERDIRCDF